MNEVQLPQKSLLKVVVLGDAGVGKTSVVKQYVNETFDEHYKPTIGADFLTKDVHLPNRRPLKLQLWDTAGQERFRSMAVSFYRGADACVLVYDICDLKTFENLDMWMKEFLQNVGVDNEKEDFPFVVLGNKADLPEKKVSTASAEAWCSSKKNVSHFETSALSKKNLNEAFDRIAEAAGRCPPPVALKDVHGLSQPEALNLDDSKAFEDEPDADEESETPSELEPATQEADEQQVDEAKSESPDESAKQSKKKIRRKKQKRQEAGAEDMTPPPNASHRLPKGSKNSQKEHRHEHKSKAVRKNRRNSTSSSNSRDRDDDRSLPSNDSPRGDRHSRRNTPHRHGRMDNIRLDEEDRYSTSSDPPVGCCEL